ncbi:MAG TPA: CapA family protein [Anaeromyxobacter sp.]|nr:CapA family protein [Anaeromyxobacter sp.]
MKKIAASLALLVAAACAHRQGSPPAGPAQAPAATATPAGQGEGEPTPTSKEPAAPLTVAAVGDVMLGSSFPDETGGLLPPDDGAHLLDEVAPILRAADLAFGNLEGPLADSGTSDKCARSRPGRCYAFRVPTRYARHLAEAGFDVVSVANNHAGDFGEAGRASTRAALAASGIRWAGVPGEIARLEVERRRVAVVAFSTSGGTPDLRDLDAAARLVAEAGEGADLVVVSFHGGAEGADRQHVPPGREEFLGEDRGDLRAFARAVVAAGADLVIGHGPHVVRGMEVIGGRLVAYSLGNFATYGGMNLSGPNGLSLVLEVKLAPDGTFLGGRIHAARQERPGGPRLDPAGAVIPVVRRLSQEDFGASAVQVEDDGTIAAPGRPDLRAGQSSRGDAVPTRSSRPAPGDQRAATSPRGRFAGSSRP